MGNKYTLKAAAHTVHWGFYDGNLAPVLTVKSGDTVILDSVSGGLDNIPAPSAGFAVLPEHLEILSAVDQGPGPHILTGPIAVEGAEPGDTLRVDILDVRLRQNWGFNMTRPGFGALPEDFPSPRQIHIAIDAVRGVATMPWGLEIKTSPFFGCMGTAPPSDRGRLSSVEPREYGGNIDNRELVAGAVLFLPVFTRGALFSAGDGHAAQGHGEVNLTAIETALTGTFRFSVMKDFRLERPRAETPTHFMTMAFDPDLDRAAKVALRDMILFIQSCTSLGADDAYALCSVAADLIITQIVDGNKGVHVTLPRYALSK
jgi:acetamidase/formamidase